MFLHDWWFCPCSWRLFPTQPSSHARVYYRAVPRGCSGGSEHSDFVAASELLALHSQACLQGSALLVKLHLFSIFHLHVSPESPASWQPPHKPLVSQAANVGPQLCDLLFSFENFVHPLLSHSSTQSTSCNSGPVTGRLPNPYKTLQVILNFLKASTFSVAETLFF